MAFQKGITIVTPRISTSSGTKTYVQNVVKGLEGRNIAFRRMEIRKREFSFGGKPRLGFLSQYASSKLISAHTRVVHSFSPSTIIRGTNVVTVHDIIPLLRKDIYFEKWYDRLVFEKVNSRILGIPYLLVSTELGKIELLKRMQLDADRIRVFHHPVDHELFYPSTHNPYQDRDKINVLMVSDFNPRKRVDIAIEALKNNKEINFYHIGPVNAWEGNYRRAIDSTRNSENIHFLGNLTFDKMRDYLTYADIFLFLTEAEGFGLPPVEALACGTNVIVSDIPVFHETLQDIAFFVSTDNFSADMIFEAIKRKRDPHKLIEYSKKFSVDSYASSLIDLYDSLNRD